MGGETSQRLISTIENIKRAGLFDNGKRSWALDKEDGDGSVQYTLKWMVRNATIEYAFDEKAGMNLVMSRKFTNQVLEWQGDFTWEKQGNAFVPTIMRSTSFKASGMVDKKEFFFTDQVVDKQLPPDMFTLSKLGVKDGDRIIDNIQKKEFIYQAGELVDAPFESKLGDWKKSNPPSPSLSV